MNWKTYLKKKGARVGAVVVAVVLVLALIAGALGGKLLGAGGGGFLVFYVDQEHRQAVRDALADLLYVPFRFENGGTRVIHFSPENYTPKASEEY